MGLRQIYDSVVDIMKSDPDPVLIGRLKVLNAGIDCINQSGDFEASLGRVNPYGFLVRIAEKDKSFEDFVFIANEIVPSESHSDAALTMATQIVCALAQEKAKKLSQQVYLNAANKANL